MIRRSGHSATARGRISLTCDDGPDLNVHIGPKPSIRVPALGAVHWPESALVGQPSALTIHHQDRG